MLFSIKKIIKGFMTLGILILVAIVGIGVILTTLYPMAYKEQIKKYGKEFKVDPFLIAAVINVESNYDKNAVSPKDARGLMQIGPQTGQWGSEVLNIENYNDELLFEPDVNIKIGSWYLNQLFKEFNGDIKLVLAAYNAGSGNVSKWLKDEEYCSDGKTLDNIPFKETRDYLVKVDKNYSMYKLIYGRYMKLDHDKKNIYIDLINNIRSLVKGFIKSFI